MTLKEIFVGKTEKTEVQMLRNVIVEATRIGINMLMLWLLYFVILGLPDTDEYPIQKSVCTAVASMLSGIVNYIFSTLWVFHKKQKGNNIKRFIVFTLIGAIGLALITGITVVLSDYCGINLLISNLIAQVIVFFFNFFMRKKIVYTLMSKEENE